MNAQRRQEAVAILKMLILDIMVGLRSLDLFSKLDDTYSLSENMRVGLSRMSTTHLVLALTKWMEFYEQYKDLLPNETALTAKALYKKLKSRGVRDFRNKVVGHIWDEEAERPLSADAMQQRLAGVIGTSEEAFNRWIYDPNATDAKQHVIGLTEEIRNALESETDAL